MDTRICDFCLQSDKIILAFITKRFGRIHTTIDTCEEHKDSPPDNAQAFLAVKGKAITKYTNIRNEAPGY